MHTTKNYKQCRMNGKKTYLHRKVWIEANGPIPNGYEIHHINNNKHDNRLENLAMVTHKENNQRQDSKGYTYESKSKHRPYVGKRVINGVVKFIGNYGTKCGAIMAHRLAFIQG